MQILSGDYKTAAQEIVEASNEPFTCVFRLGECLFIVDADGEMNWYSEHETQAILRALRSVSGCAERP